MAAADVLCVVQLKVPQPVQQENESDNSKRSDHVRYQHIWEDDQFSMGYVRLAAHPFSPWLSVC